MTESEEETITRLIAVINVDNISFTVNELSFIKDAYGLVVSKKEKIKLVDIKKIKTKNKL